MHLADLKSYLEADQRLRELYADFRRVGAQGCFECGGFLGSSPSDRTIAEYGNPDLGGEAMARCRRKRIHSRACRL